MSVFVELHSYILPKIRDRCAFAQNDDVVFVQYAEKLYFMSTDALK